MTSLRPFPKLKIIRQLRIIEKAIKKKCYDCQGGQKRVDCELETCSLYQFRPWAKKTARDDFKKDNKFRSLVKTSKSS